MSRDDVAGYQDLNKEGGHTKVLSILNHKDFSLGLVAGLNRP